MSHFVAYLNNPNRRLELDADNVLDARRCAAMLLGTRREYDIELIECTQSPSLADLLADTEE